jgi:glucose-6-phosphate 1-dehydrogenase
MAKAGTLPPDAPVVGVASRDWSPEQLRKYARESIEARTEVDEDVWNDLVARIQYVSGDYREPGTFERLAELITDCGHPLYYLAIPPKLFDDVIQNHLLQIVALLAMEPPAGSDAEALRDEKQKVFRQIATIPAEQVVRGQYRGYVDEPGVAPGSDVETFAAVCFEIDSWRWSGVPWLLRAGKKLPVTATEAVITFHEPPRLLFTDADSPNPEPNRLRFRISPEDGVVLHLFSMEPGDRVVSEALDLEVEYEKVYGKRSEAYQRLLEDALEGDTRRFGRADNISEQWRIVDDLINDPHPVRIYEPGHWGPQEGCDLALPHGGWLDPKVGDSSGG